MKNPEVHHTTQRILNINQNINWKQKNGDKVVVTIKKEGKLRFANTSENTTKSNSMKSKKKK